MEENKIKKSNKTESNPLVSVITPAYKAEKILPETITSIINQSYTNWEYLIIEDISPDNTLKVAKEFANKDNRIYVDVSGKENSKRPAIPRNIALRRAKGKYIAFIDADDQWLPDKLKIQVEFLKNNPDYLGVCSTANIIFPDGKNKTLDYFQNKDITVNDIYNENIIITSSTIVREEIFDKTGGFPEDMKFRGFEDYALWLKATTLGKFRLLNSPLIKYSDDPQNSVRGRVKTSSWIVFSDIFKEYLEWLLKNRLYSKVPRTLNKLIKLNIRIIYLKLKNEI